MRENRPSNVKRLMSRYGKVISKHYDHHSAAQQQIILDKWEKLSEACARYIKLEIVWDWKLIDVGTKVIDQKCRTKDVSTFDCVMQFARDLGKEITS